MLWFLFLLVFVFYLLYSQLIANNLEFYSLLRKQKKCKQFAKYSIIIGAKLGGAGGASAPPLFLPSPGIFALN